MKTSKRKGRQGRCTVFSPSSNRQDSWEAEKGPATCARLLAVPQHSIAGIQTAFSSDECLLTILRNGTWNQLILKRILGGIYQCVNVYSNTCLILRRHSFRLRQGLPFSGLTCCHSQAMVKLGLPSLVHQFYFMLKKTDLFFAIDLSFCFKKIDQSCSAISLKLGKL